MSEVQGAATTFSGACESSRVQLKSIAAYVKTLVDGLKNTEVDGTEDRGEKIANLMLAYRHLEDASMRLGKAIQAHDGGVSVYDKTKVVGA